MVESKTDSHFPLLMLQKEMCKKEGKSRGGEWTVTASVNSRPPPCYRRFYAQIYFNDDITVAFYSFYSAIFFIA
jgi:hypothetical protein